jgi:hypothetical protein
MIWSLQRVNDTSPAFENRLQQDIPQADPGSLDLLDELPAGETDFAAAPSEVLRWLFEAFRLEVRYHKPSNWANCRVTLGDQPWIDWPRTPQS